MAILNSIKLNDNVAIPLYGFRTFLIPNDGSSGMRGTNAELAGSCKGAKLIEGKRFTANASEAELKKWAKDKE